MVAHEDVVNEIIVTIEKTIMLAVIVAYSTIMNCKL